MKAKTTDVTIPRKNIIRVALLTVLILSVPLIAMQFSDEVDWSLSDFIFIGMLLFGAGLIYELLASRVHSSGHRIAIGLAVAAAVLLTWVELAVGIFD